MGLDMFLFTVEKGMPFTRDAKKFTTGYWRKFSALHGWFVQNVQGGVDEGYPFLVTKEQLEKVLSLLEQVKQDFGHAEELLPVQSDAKSIDDSAYGEDYQYSVKRSIVKIKGILEHVDFDVEDLYYIASW